MSTTEQFAALFALPLGRLLLAALIIAAVLLPVVVKAMRFHQRRAEGAELQVEQLSAGWDVHPEWAAIRHRGKGKA